MSSPPATYFKASERHGCVHYRSDCPTLARSKNRVVVDITTLGRGFPCSICGPKRGGV